jgi:hypothetical protein
VKKFANVAGKYMLQSSLEDCEQVNNSLVDNLPEKNIVG